jgi:hypothetical protein
MNGSVEGWGRLTIEGGKGGDGKMDVRNGRAVEQKGRREGRKDREEGINGKGGRKGATSS